VMSFVYAKLYSGLFLYFCMENECIVP